MKYSDFFLFLLQLSTGLFITPLSMRISCIHYGGSFTNIIIADNNRISRVYLLEKRMIMTND